MKPAGDVTSGLVARLHHLTMGRLNGTDLTWVVYPIVILFTGAYIIPNLYNLIGRWGQAPMIAVTYLFMVISFTLIPVGFVYLALKKVRLKFKLSVLSVIGMILIVVFSRGLIEYFSQGHSLLDILTIGFDHWTFPIAFGFFYLCDLSKIPRRFWLLLLPFALFAFVMGNAILIGNSISNSNMFQCIGGPNFPFAFFGVNNWQEVQRLPTQRFLDGLIDGFLQEFLTFQTLLPVVILYNVFSKGKIMKKKIILIGLVVLIVGGFFVFKGILQPESEKGCIKLVELTPKEPALQGPTSQGLSPFAIAITQDGEYAYLGFDLSEDVFKVRLDNLTIEAAADLSDYFPIENEHMALDVTERKLFVHSTTWRKLIVLDTQTLDVIHVIDDISATGMFQSQYGPFIITWTSRMGESNVVKFINTETYEVTKFTDETIGFLWIQESKHNQSTWYVVTNTRVGGQEMGLVGSYDYTTKTWDNKVLFPLTEGDGSFDFKVLPNEQKAYVASTGGWSPEGNHASGWVHSIDLAEGKAKSIPIDGGALSLEASPDSQRLYVGTGWPIASSPRLAPSPNGDNLLVVDTRSDNIMGPINLGRNKYGWYYSQMNDLQIDPAHPNLMYATNSDGNAFLKVNLDTLTLADVIVLNEESFQPSIFARQPTQTYGYMPIYNSTTVFELDIGNATIRRVVAFPSLRSDVSFADIALSDTGRMFVAQGDGTVLEIDSQSMCLREAHALPKDAPTVWRFVLSRDQKRLYSVSQQADRKGWNPNVFLAINTENFQTMASFRLEGGAFVERPYELPDSSKLYALGGESAGPVVIQVISTDNYTLQKTITFNEPDSLGVTGGAYYPFAYDSKSHTLFVGATHVVLAIDTDTDVIKKVIYLKDVAKAIGLEGLNPWELTYLNAVGLVYSAPENFLYIAHLDRSFVSLYDLNNDRFLPKVIPLKGYFPRYMFANDDFSRMYTLNARSDSVSVIDIKSKTLEKVIDLHAYD